MMTRVNANMKAEGGKQYYGEAIGIALFDGRRYPISTRRIEYLNCPVASYYRFGHEFAEKSLKHYVR